MRCAAARFEGDGMKIAEGSKRYGVSTDTLRYYERIGLLPAIARNKSGNRDYSSIDCERIEFIKCMREAGLSIEVLTRYMHLFLEGDSTLKEREELLIAERDRLENDKNEQSRSVNFTVGALRDKMG